MNRLLSRSGGAPIAVYLVAAGAITLAGVVWKVSRLQLFDRGPSATKVASQVAGVHNAQAEIDKAVEQALQAERARQAEQEVQIQQGHQYVTGTGLALDAAAPSAKADPAVQLASRLNAKADKALTSAVGELSAEQKAWVLQLVRDATSASEERRAAAERAMRFADDALAVSQQREIEARKRLEEANANVARAREAKEQLEGRLEATLLEKNAIAAFLDRVLRWVIYAGIAYAVIAYGLPLLALAFPVLKPIASAAHAVIAPLGAKAKSEAEGLARDASAALHNLLQTVKARAPQLAAEAEQIKAEWITEADGTALRHHEALREANQL